MTSIDTVHVVRPTPFKWDQMWINENVVQFRKHFFSFLFGRLRTSEHMEYENDGDHHLWARCRMRRIAEAVPQRRITRLDKELFAYRTTDA